MVTGDSAQFGKEEWIRNKLAKLGDAIAIFKSETMNH